jgi:hypothetical protein
MSRGARILTAVCASVAVVLFDALPALAHSDQGIMTAEARPGSRPQTVTARARVVFANDGHPANDAAVTVTGTGPNGAQVGPTALNRVDDGEYEATVTVAPAGEWSLVFSSANPAATAGTTFTVATGTPGTAPAGQTPRASTGNDTKDDSSGLNAAVFPIVGGAAVVLAVVGGLVVVRRRRQ